MKKPLIIGIAGGSSSGKTSVAKIIYDHFNNDASVTIVREDDYYKFQTIPFEERKKTNYDHPFAFDFDLMYKHIDDLVAGKPIEKPIYDYTIHNRSDKTETVNPADVIIIEGLFVLEEKATRDRLDIKVFVDTPSDVRLTRRLIRDIKERGRDLDNIIDQYLTTVRVMHEEFIEPSKKYANVIIPEGRSNDVGIDLLITKIHSIIG
ncbi:MAG: uridine kinase [Erysipelotrichaceae bacterium]|nr:uridine kinase [Erysipelotrichaceae bacterium]